MLGYNIYIYIHWLVRVPDNGLFPTCQVRVVRFYVSLFSSFSSCSSFRRPPPPVVLLNCDPVSSVWHAGPQPRSCECSVACRAPTACSVASRTPTAILRVQCGVPDPNRDPVSSVWRAGPQVLCQKICQKE